MPTTEERAPETIAAAAPVRPAPADTRSWLGQRISTEAAIMLGTVWYVLFSIGVAVEPQTDASAPVLATALGFVSLGLLALMAVGLVARRRWGLLAALGGGGLFLALSVACPTTGHHPVAAWWFVQMACAVGLVGASAYALRRA